jgi:hypothetical protein
MAGPSGQQLARSFVGHMVANPQLLNEFKKLPPSTDPNAPPGAKGAADVADLIKKHMGIEVSAEAAASMGPHLNSTAEAIAKVAPASGISSRTFADSSVFGGRGN